MKKEKWVKMDILPAAENIIFEQRESGVTHTPFQLEHILYIAIQNGDAEVVETAIENYLKHGLVVGRMSLNNTRQMRYWAVACISIAIHYAILGGLDETDAYNLSDTYIRYVDGLTDVEECVTYLKTKAVELVTQVRESKERNVYSPIIKKCLHYIHIHLHERLSITELASQLGVSRDYLSTLFKKEMKRTLHAYILHEKLEASKQLLMQGESYNTICYSFAFCSETHYITCYKREYGMTPGEYRKGNLL